VLHQASSVLVLNDNFTRYVEGVGVAPERVHVLPNWTHVARPRDPRATVRRRLGWRQDEVIALHSGNMGLKQGLENIVAAAKISATEAPDVRFVLMGDGSQRAALEALGEGLPTLSFLPPANDRDFPEVLAAADVLLVNERASALDMSLPSKLTSYFRADMPVIAAVPGLGGTAREVKRSGAGVVVEPEQARSLLEGVVALAGDADLLQVFRAAARRHSDRNLDATRALRRFTALIGTALAPAVPVFPHSLDAAVVMSAPGAARSLPGSRSSRERTGGNQSRQVRAISAAVTDRARHEGEGRAGRRAGDDRARRGRRGRGRRGSGRRGSGRRRQDDLALRHRRALLHRVDRPGHDDDREQDQQHVVALEPRALHDITLRECDATALRGAGAVPGRGQARAVQRRRSCLAGLLDGRSAGSVSRAGCHTDAEPAGGWRRSDPRSPQGHGP